MTKRSLLFLVALLLIGCGSDDADEAPTAPVAETATQGATGRLAEADKNGDGIVYQSGMHPWIVEDEPGQCPICGMDLQAVPVSGSASGTVEIDPVTLQNIGVRTVTAEVTPLERTLRTTGVFEADERLREAVSLKIGGWVEELYVNYEGDRVRRGQPLLELYAPDLLATQQELLLALRNRDILGGGTEADRLVEATRTRLQLFGISDAQIDRLEETGEVQRTLTLYAPASGTVIDKNVVEGQQVMAGQTLMQIVGLGQLWLQVDVPEQDLGWVEVGSRAVIALPSAPGAETTGTVSYIYDLLDPQTRTGRARITVRNDGSLKPGMYATATLFGAPSEAYPTVPTDAVIRTGAEAVVVLALGEGQFRPQPVTLGAEADGRVQILEGLEGGESVVSGAQFLIDSESRLSGAVASMEHAAMGHGDMGTEGTEMGDMEMDGMEMNDPDTSMENQP